MEADMEAFRTQIQSEITQVIDSRNRGWKPRIHGGRQSPGLMGWQGPGRLLSRPDASTRLYYRSYSNHWIWTHTTHTKKPTLQTTNRQKHHRNHTTNGTYDRAVQQTAYTNTTISHQILHKESIQTNRWSYHSFSNTAGWRCKPKHN